MGRGDRSYMMDLFNQYFDQKYINTRFSFCMDVNPQLSKENQILLQEILIRIINQTIVKFEKGAIEHGGNLLERDLDFESHQESIDQLVYSTAKQIKNDKLKGSLI